MKKKIIFILISLFIGVGIVNAKSFYASDQFGTCGSVGMVSTNGKDIFYDNAGTYYDNWYMSKFTFSNGKISYCHNAGLSSGKATDNQEYEAEELLVNCTNDTCKAYEAGVIAILREAETNQNYSGKNYSYVQTTWALRVFELFWNIDTNISKHSKSGSDYIAMHELNYLYFNEFVKDNEIKSITTNINNKISGSGPISLTAKKITDATLKKANLDSSSIKFCKTDCNQNYDCTNGDYTTQVKTNMLKLVKVGLNASFKQANEGSASTSIKKKNTSKTEKETIVNYEIKLNKFKNGNPYYYINAECPDCSKNGINMSLYANNQLIDKNTNLVNFVNNGTGTIRLKVVFNGDNVVCTKLNYKLNIRYKDETISTVAYKINTKAKCSYKSCQELYMLESTDTEVTKTLEHNTDVCINYNCEDLKLMCERGNSVACKEFKDKFNSTCAYCASSVSEVNCSDDDQVVNIIEGKEYTAKDSCVHKNPVNVKQCILNNEDKSGNAYESFSNNYCSIACKEDYRITLPGIVKTESGTKFSLSVGIKGTKTCYTSKINKQQFNLDYTSAATAQDKAKIQEEYNKCSNFDMTYNYDPKISFKYEESYYNNMLDKNLKTKGNVTKSAIDTKVCTGEVTDDSYETCASTWTTDTTNASYVKKSISVEATYIPPKQFYRVHPSGAIISSINGEKIENGTEIGNNYPVGHNTAEGVYTYSLKVNDLGEYYSGDHKGELGRIWGSENSVVVNTINDDVCKYDGSIEDETEYKDGTYVCAYKVDCPDCEVECTPKCDNPDCPDCPPQCIDCISGTEINYRPITPEDINPNDRNLGENWAHDNSISTALEMKAYATTKEIEDKGETIYDVDYNSTDGEFAMKVTLDSKTISWIRSYNDDQKSKGGYLSNSLKCYDYNHEGTTYQNVFCYSTFIDKLINETGGPNAKGGSEKVKIAGGTRYSKESDRKNKTADSGYWTTWSKATYNPAWTIVTTSELALYQQKYGTDVKIGPSWK